MKNIMGVKSRIISIFIAIFLVGMSCIFLSIHFVNEIIREQCLGYFFETEGLLFSFLSLFITLGVLSIFNKRQYIKRKEFKFIHAAELLIMMNLIPILIHFEGEGDCGKMADGRNFLYDELLQMVSISLGLLMSYIIFLLLVYFGMRYYPFAVHPDKSQKKKS